MNHSPKTLIGALLGLILLASAATAVPVGAHGLNRDRRRSTAGHARKDCRRRDGCGADTGGTRAGGAVVPKSPRRADIRREASPRRQIAPRSPALDAEPTPGKNRVAAEVAAVIAAVLAVPCANTELTPTDEDIALVRGAVLCLINRERAEHGLSPLTVNPRLESAAEGHCGELIADDYFAHISPSGETPVDRIRKTGYIPGPSVGYVIGENLAWGTYNLSTPQSIVSAWIASPGHLANILESQYTETGIGIVPQVPAAFGGGSPGATYAQEFGVIVA